MTDSNLQKQRHFSRSCNEDVLLNIGLKRVSNSSLFKSTAGHLFLSPGISEGLHEKYWFDIRDVNFQKMTKETKNFVLLRIVPAWFAFFPLDHIRRYLNKKTKDIRKNSGIVYGFYCELDENNRAIEITAKNDMAAKFSVALLNRGKVQQDLSTALKI